MLEGFVESRKTARQTVLARCVNLKRPSLYKILPKNGNPTLATLEEILPPLGLRVSVARDEAA